MAQMLACSVDELTGVSPLEFLDERGRTLFGENPEGSPGLFIALEFRLRRMSCGVHEETANGYEGTASWS
jgi:hypothetical protein